MTKGKQYARMSTMRPSRADDRRRTPSKDTAAAQITAPAIGGRISRVARVLSSSLRTAQCEGLRTCALVRSCSAPGGWVGTGGDDMEKW